MIFMLPFHADEQAFASMSSDERNVLVERHLAFRAELAANAQVIDGRELYPAHTAVTTRPLPDAPTSPSPPVAGPSEVFTGYHLIECADEATAVALAEHYPMPEGFGYIEVRQVVSSWDYTPSQETVADAAAIWERYIDLDSWPRWQQGVRAAELNGPFQSGAVGALTRVDGRQVPWRITEVNEGMSFCSETELVSGAMLRTEYVLETLRGGGTKIIHRADVPEAVGREFGAGLYDELRHSVAALVADVEAELSEPGRVGRV